MTATPETAKSSTTPLTTEILVSKKSSSSTSIIRNAESQLGGGWSSQLAFLVACIASAVGLGNIWRFPYLAYKYGGGAFFVPYLLAFSCVGIPVLILEFSVGQVYQGGSPKSFSKIHPRLRGVGFGASVTSFICVSYYSLIIVWAMFYFIHSFRTDLPWGYSHEQLAQCKVFGMDMDRCLSNSCVWKEKVGCRGNVLKNAMDFLTYDVHVAEDPNEALTKGSVGVSLYTAGLMILLWFTAYITTCWGARILGKILYFTMALPTICLLVLLGVGLSQDGAMTGVKAYIGVWDFSMLADNTIWTNATGQIIFSLGLALGIMTAYASHNSKDQNVTLNAVVVTTANSVFSFFAGFVVFSFAGSLAKAADLEIEDLKMSGHGLAFMTYPVGVSILPYPWSQIICIFFFVTLFFLGFDTILSNILAAACFLTDSVLAKRLSYNAMIGITTLGLCIMSVLFYSLSIGFTLLDIVDNILNNVCLLSICMGETIAVGWVYGIGDTMKYVGKKAVYVLSLTLFGGFLIAMVFLNSLPNPTNIIVGLVLMFVSIVLAFGVSGWLALKTERINQLSTKEKLWILYMGNIEGFRSEVNIITSQPNSCWRVPFLWSILIKYVVPFALEFMVVNFVVDPKNTTQYGGYSAGFLVFGLILNLVIAFVVIGGAVYPKMFDILLDHSDKPSGLLQQDDKTAEF